MFRKILYFNLFLGITTLHLIFGQRTHHEIVALKKEQFSLPNRKFYIQQIHCDFKQPKYFISRKGLFNKQQPFVLGDSVQKVVLNYLKPSNTYKGGLVPIIMKIKELKVREERHFLNEDGSTKISVEFYVYADKGIAKIYQANAFRTYSGFMNITTQHEENIREVIKSCLTDFNNAKIDFSQYIIPNKIFKAKHTPY
jgi:hypothetical protein